MAREVTHDATGPRLVDEDDIDPEHGDIAICCCGLSGEYPFCDGAHRATEDEAPEATYKYEDDDADGERREIERIEFVEGSANS